MFVLYLVALWAYVVPLETVFLLLFVYFCNCVSYCISVFNSWMLLFFNQWWKFIEPNKNWYLYCRIALLSWWPFAVWAESVWKTFREISSLSEFDKSVKTEIVILQLKIPPEISLKVSSDKILQTLFYLVFAKFRISFNLLDMLLDICTWNYFWKPRKIKKFCNC